MSAKAFAAKSRHVAAISHTNPERPPFLGGTAMKFRPLHDRVVVERIDAEDAKRRQLAA